MIDCDSVDVFISAVEIFSIEMETEIIPTSRSETRERRKKGLKHLPKECREERVERERQKEKKENKIKTISQEEKQIGDQRRLSLSSRAESLFSS